MAHSDNPPVPGGMLHRAPGASSIGRFLKWMGIRPRVAVILIPYVWLTMLMMALIFVIPSIVTAFVPS